MNPEGHEDTGRKSPCAKVVFSRAESFSLLHERGARAYIYEAGFFLGFAMDATTEMARTPATTPRATGVGISK
jgi:hypothetical protein